MNFLKGHLLALTIILLGTHALAQTNPNLEQGFKPYGSYSGGDFDSISLTNGNLTVCPPLFSYPQRGSLTRNLKMFCINNKNFMVRQNCNQMTGVCNDYWLWDPGPPNNYAPADPDDIAIYAKLVNKSPAVYSFTAYGGDGGVHQLALSAAEGPNNYVAIDNSGIQWVGTVTQGTSLRRRNGDQPYEDRNGNEFSSSGIFIDTLGRALPSSSTATTDFTGCVGPLPVANASISNYPGPGNVNGGVSQVKMCYATVTVTTNFNTTNFETSPAMLPEVASAHPSLVQSVVIYNGSNWSTSPAWEFEYNDRDPGDPSNINYGDLTKITLPTGGSISYSWQTFYACDEAAITPASRAIASRTVNANDGTGDHTTQYIGAGSGYTVVDPSGNYVVHASTGLGGTCSLYETETRYYTGAYPNGTLLKTVDIGYAYQQNPFDLYGDGSTTMIDVHPTSIKTTLPNGKVSEVDKSNYDQAFQFAVNGVYANVSYAGNPGDVYEYDYGSGAHGGLLRHTKTVYQALSNSNYLNANLLDLPQSVTVSDGAGNQIAQTTYSYDEYALQPSGVSTQRDTTIPNPGTRGNATTVGKWVAGSTTVASHTHYYDTGMPYTATDPGGHLTTYSFSTSYQGGLLTQTQMPDTSSPNLAHHSVSGTYDFNTGLLTSFTDQNGKVSNYVYDGLWRMSSATLPDGGSATFNYPDLVTVERQEKIDTSGRATDVFAQFDGLGRPIRHAAVNGQSSNPWDQNDTCYAADGTVALKSYAFQASGFATARDCAGSTHPGDSFSYDGLERVTQVLHSDGSHLDTQYTGAAVETTDEGNGTATVSRITQSDALGRIVNVCEVSAATQLGMGSAPAACGLDIPGTGFLTTYAYNGYSGGPVETVSQGGYTQRSFTYDGLHRLVNATNPETGTVTYSYTPDSLVQTRTRPAPNQTNPATVVTTTYTFDPLHRETGVTYSDGTTPTATFNFDESTVAGQATINPLGRLTSETTANTGEYFWNFDAMGRAQGRSQCVPSPANHAVCGGYYNSAYGFDYLGDELTATLPSGVQLTQAYNVTPQLVSLTSSLGDSNHPPTLFSSAQYGPFGLSSVSIGDAVTESLTYAPRGWLNGLNDSLHSVSGIASVSFSGSERSAQIPAPTPASGSVTINGSERNTQVQTAPATSGTGSVTVTGGEQSVQVQTQAAQTAYVTISITGAEQSMNPGDCPTPPGPPCLWDGGTVYVTVNGVTISANYGKGSSTTQIANLLYGQVNSSFPATASLNSPSITFYSKKVGAAGNADTFSSSVSYDDADFFHASFAVSPASGNFANGLNAVYTTLYDAGTATITVNGHGDSYAWGNGSTTSTIAAGLATAINGDGAAAASASASGASVSLTARTTGAGTNYSLSSSTTWDTGHFGGPSYGFSNSGGTLTGGLNATYTTDYDSGTVTTTVNGLAKSVSYGQNSTGTSIASAIASAFNGDGTSAVTASASSNVVSFLTKTSGASTNYNLSASSSTSDSHFSGASFTTAPSGATLTGGTNNGGVQTVYDSGTASVTVNGHSNQVNYGQSDTPTSIASNLAGNVNADATAAVTATANGGTVTLVAKTAGSGSNYAFNSASQTTNSNFTGTSFPASPASGTLSDGANLSGTIYSFSMPSTGGYAPDGNILQANDSANGNWTYTYDSFNRLSTAVASNIGAGCSYAYDRFGNRWQQNPYAGGSCYSVQQTYTMNNGGNNNNQMDGASYDAAGNLLHDPNTGANYTYDAEGRLITAGAYSYIYDAEGRRVAKLSSGTITNEYLFDSSGAQQVELDGSGNVLHTNVFAGGKLLATYQGSQTYFHFSDWLGNRRVEINAQGQTTLTCSNYPFGDGLSCTGSMDPTEHHFTGKERDTETGLDFFGARYLSAAMGRWVSPDWSESPDAIPYSDLNDPQSFNLYAYGHNNPATYPDRDGHDSLDSQRNAAREKAWKQEQDLVRRTGQGTRNWTASEKAELLSKGRVSGYEAHHINSVKDHPELAGDPANIKFVKGRAGNLAEHGGDFRNPTSGDLLNRVVIGVQVLGMLVQAWGDFKFNQQESETGLHSDPIKGVQITNVDKAGQTLAPGTQAVTPGGDVFTLGEDGIWRDRAGNTIHYDDKDKQNHIQQRPL